MLLSRSRKQAAPKFAFAVHAARVNTPKPPRPLRLEREISAPAVALSRQSRTKLPNVTKCYALKGNLCPSPNPNLSSRRALRNKSKRSGATASFAQATRLCCARARCRNVVQCFLFAQPGTCHASQRDASAWNVADRSGPAGRACSAVVARRHPAKGERPALSTAVERRRTEVYCFSSLRRLLYRVVADVAAANRTQPVA